MSDLPLILAGPVVRRVDPRACSFWVALREQALVKANLWDGPRFAGASPDQDSNGDAVLTTGQANTTRFGEHLHVAVVTIDLSDAQAPVPPLNPGTVYSYNLEFTGAFGQADLKSERLLQDEQSGNRLAGVDAAAPLHLALGYAENRLPSFVTVPPTLDRLRFTHSSCRKSNGPGYDALAWLDDRIKDTQDNIDERPQQLFLTGDQIYADDVGSCLLPMLTALGHDVLGRAETLPVKGAPIELTASDFPPLRRARLVREQAKFSSTEADNHLLGFSEYAAMYLAAWSPRVWRTLADVDSLFASLADLGASPSMHDVLTDWEGCYGDVGKWRDKEKKGLDAEKGRVELFRQGVPHVARALANVATYMILDDHEVTDDWNLNAKWRNRVYTNSLGKAIVSNAVMAYGVFQGWGNDPKAFTSGNNKDFLAETVQYTAAGNPPPGPSDRMLELQGIGGGGAAKQAVWNYQVPATDTHRTVVMDSRTHRKFTGQSYLPPSLLGDTLNTQVPSPAPGQDLLILISPAPVVGPHILDQIGQPLAQEFFDAKAYSYNRLTDKPHDPCSKGPRVVGAEEFDAEGWATNEAAQEALLARVAEYGKAIILSGDVHYGVSLALDYWRKGQEAKPARIAQFTSSPAHNSFHSTVEAVLRSNAQLQLYEQGVRPERLMWTDKAPFSVPANVHLSPGRIARLNRKPAILPANGWPPNTTFPADKAPDGRWRLTMLRDQRPNGDLPEKLRQPPLPGPELDTNNPQAGYAAVASRHAVAAMTHFDHLRQMVFTCNIGLISFFLDQSNVLGVRQTLLSKSGPDDPEASQGAPNTVHEMLLAPTQDQPPVLAP